MSRPSRHLRALTTAAVLCALGAATGSQRVDGQADGPPGAKPAPGRLLVAARQLRDPNFGETVVLLLEHGADGALGVILNRPTTVEVTAAFPGISALAERPDRVHFGGPVAPLRMLMLLRSKEEREDSRRVLEDLYWTGSQEVLEAVAGDGSSSFRVFAGHSGWAGGQLENEISRGDWHILEATLDVVFDAKPLELWPKLLRRIPTRWAAGLRPRAGL